MPFEDEDAFFRHIAIFPGLFNSSMLLAAPSPAHGAGWSRTCVAHGLRCKREYKWFASMMLEPHLLDMLSVSQGRKCLRKENFFAAADTSKQNGLCTQKNISYRTIGFCMLFTLLNLCVLRHTAISPGFQAHRADIYKMHFPSLGTIMPCYSSRSPTMQDLSGHDPEAPLRDRGLLRKAPHR